MSRYLLTSRAKNDLAEIRHWYSATRSPKAAQKTIADIRAQLQNLLAHPGIGHRDDELASPAHLFWSYRQFLIVYLKDTDPLQVVTIWDARRGDPELG